MCSLIVGASAVGYPEEGEAGSRQAKLELAAMQEARELGLPGQKAAVTSG
jgi:hypothetical protein